MTSTKWQRGALGSVLALGLTSSAFAQGVTQDKLHSYTGLISGPAVFTPATARPGASASNYAMDFGVGGANRWVLVTNVTFLNTAATNNEMSFALWVRKYDIAQGSAFWANSASAAGTRGWQAHIPWDNNNIYFDTMGCCDYDVTRINGSTDTFPGYTGDVSWWNNWHHFVFSKKGDTKQIWIDGQLFLEGLGTNPLMPDFTSLYIGAANASGSLHGLIDDFAVYGTALTDAQINSLFTGTAPDALDASTQLLAYWPFDDAPVLGTPIGSPVGFTITAFDVGGNVIDPTTATLMLNGQTVAPTSATKNGLATLVTYLLPNPPFPPGSTNTTSITIKDQNNNSYTSTGSFVVGQFSTLPASMALPASAVDKSKKGFKIRTYQADDPSTGNGVQVAEDILAGKYGPNVANLTDAGGVDANGYFTWPGTINFDVFAPAVNGRFNDPDYPDTQFPGIPGSGVNILGEEHFACELFTALEFPAAGLYTMVVNSDDCFATYSGPNPLDVLSSVRLGAFDSPGGRGAADTAFQFFVQQPGVYGFRTVYEQGAGGGNMEWFMLSNSIPVLINDVTNSIAAYQWVPTITGAYVKSATPGNLATDADPDVIRAVIVDGSNPVNQNTVSLQIDNAPVNATISKTGNETTVNYKASPLLAAKSTHTAKLIFTDGAAQVTNQWQFTVAGYTKDLVNNYFGTFRAEAKYSADAGGRSGAAGDYSIDLGTTDGSVYVSHAGDFLNPAATNDQMTFVIWLKRRNVTDSSVFWANSPSSPSTTRGFQAHTPWSNNNLYFDTAGCCGADTRINAPITGFSGYTGDLGWWTNWHHFAFTKMANVKQIWVDGQVLIDGDQAIPLPTDFTDMYLGATAVNSNPTHGWIDDFAVYATPLGTNDIMALAGGAAPNTLPASTQLIAYWNFNDVPVGAPTTPTISISSAGGQLSITFSGRLQSSTTADGPYTDVQGASSPYSVQTTAAQMFFRSAQ